MSSAFRISAESGHRSPPQQSLHSGTPPPPQRRSDAAFRHLPTGPSERPGPPSLTPLQLPRGAVASPQPPAVITCRRHLTGLQNYHQGSEATINRQVNLQLSTSYVYLSVSYYFDCNDVAPKNSAKYVLHPSHEEGTC